VRGESMAASKCCLAVYQAHIRPPKAMGRIQARSGGLKRRTPDLASLISRPDALDHQRWSDPSNVRGYEIDSRAG
jgi:hypothetical protein